MQVFLETPRLVLRRFTRADVDNLVSLNADPDVMRFITGGIPIGRDEIENELLPAFLGYYERFEGYGFWAATQKRTGEFLGCIYLAPREGGAPGEAELGFRLRKAAWGRDAMPLSHMSPGRAPRGREIGAQCGFAGAGVAAALWYVHDSAGCGLRDRAGREAGGGLPVTGAGFCVEPGSVA
jgi:Acetyltransferase (GNAT) domain